MWNRLNELNGEFKKIKQAKKNEKKMSSTVVNKLYLILVFFNI